MLRISIAMLSWALWIPTASAQTQSALALVDLSESGEVFHFAIPANPEQPIAVHLLAAAAWDELEFEVRGAVVGQALAFRVATGGTPLVPAITEGNFRWRAPFFTDDRGADLLFAVAPNRSRFTVALRRPTATEDAPYYPYTRFVEYFFGIQNDPGAQVTQLGESLQGRPLYRVVIDPPSPFPKKTVVMAVRQHGNEDGSSYLLEGALDHLLGRNGQVPEAELLERIRWVVYPMMNPDGAVANQRGNANGTDLNRDWNRNGCNQVTQEPETFAFQCDLENVHATWGVAIVGDHHGWGSSNHGGFRYADGQSVSFVSAAEYQEAKKDTTVITRHDPTQFLWTENGGTTGMLRAEMFLRFGFLLHTPEYNSAISTPAEFRQKGRAWLRAMHDTLYAPRFTDGAGNVRTSAAIGSGLHVTLDDDDENASPNIVDTVFVTVTDSVTGDSEVLFLTETGVDTGVFRNDNPLPLRGGAAVIENGALESAFNSTVTAAYVDDDYPRDASSVDLDVLDAIPRNSAPPDGLPHHAGEPTPIELGR